MSTGKTARLNRLFSHASGRLCSVAVDHYIGYGYDMPEGLRRLALTIGALAAGRPDAITMHKGPAAHLWEPYAGRIPLILQSSVVRADDTAFEIVATPEEAVRLGADAIAVVAFLRGPSEARYLRLVSDVVRDATRFELPVVCHVYPRSFEGDAHITFDPDDIAWAVRCAVECGPDIVKVPFCGDQDAFRQIVADCPTPLVAAGGPKTGTLLEALDVLDKVVEAGGRGATIGRNVWGFGNTTASLEAFKAVIHDRARPDEAMRLAGLTESA